jgi:hypothetical protein
METVCNKLTNLTMEKVDMALAQLDSVVAFNEKHGRAISNVSTNTLKIVLEVCHGSLDAHIKINKILKEAGYK